jgi:hypothetical protein
MRLRIQLGYFCAGFAQNEADDIPITNLMSVITTVMFSAHANWLESAFSTPRLHEAITLAMSFFGSQRFQASSFAVAVARQLERKNT